MLPREAAPLVDRYQQVVQSLLACTTEAEMGQVAALKRQLLI